jgi:hypothetical protein
MAWLLAVALAGAGLFNAVGGEAVKAEFVRWGYPAWWNLVTAAIEGLGAVLIVVPGTRMWGLALGAMVMITALATIIWCREYKHLAPAVALAALIGIELMLVVVQ